MFRRIFDAPAPRVPKVELGLQRAVLNMLALETRLLEKSEQEATLRRARVQRLTELSKDSTFQERSKWREGLPDLSAWRRRGGQKRSYSKVKKPGKDQRKKIKLANQAKTGIKPVPGSSSDGSRDLINSSVSRDLINFSVSRDQGRSGGSRERVSSSSVVCREPARSKTKKAGRILSYDELIEGEDAISFLDDPDFRFDVPEDVKNIELI